MPRTSACRSASMARARQTGGGLISRGHLYKILSNPIYIGRLAHKGRVYEGQHAAIVDQDVWDQTQALLAAQAHRKDRPSRSSDALLAGKLYDDRGNRMSPSEAAKGAKRWRYYISQAILQGRKQDAGSVARVSAAQIEAKVLEAVRSAMGEQPTWPPKPFAKLWTRSRSVRAASTSDGTIRARRTDRLERSQFPGRRRRPKGGARSSRATERSRTDLRPMRLETRRAFMAAYGKARAWLDRLVADPALTDRNACSCEGPNGTLDPSDAVARLPGPALVEAAIEGRLPRGFGLKRLMDLPPLWPEQWVALGLEAPARG